MNLDDARRALKKLDPRTATREEWLALYEVIQEHYIRRAHGLPTGDRSSDEGGPPASRSDSDS